MWIYLRHWINLKILWSTLTEFKTVGPYELNWETQQYKCWISQIITFALLASLQAVNLFWLFLILRIAKRYAFNSVREDDRSDNEEYDEEEEQIRAAEAKKLLEKDTGMPSDKPVVLENGHTTSTEAKAEGIRTRSKAK